MSFRAFNELSQAESELFSTGANLEVGSSYGDFLLLHSGAYADTYRASKVGKYFLLKAPKSCNAAYLSILRREYEISSGLDHPNIISAFTLENIPPLGPCLVMKYVEGKNLEEYLRDNPSMKSRRLVLQQLLSAIGYLHSCGIVHNDIKPANIIIRGEGNQANLKLIDFGLSDDEVHYLDKTLGCTPDYASPELLSGRGKADARSDIYSIGKIIKLMFPRRYSHIWRKCTNNNPRRRFPDTDSIAGAFNACRTANVLLIVLALLCVIGSFTLKPVLRGLEFISELEKAEHKFEKACLREGVPIDNVPHLSMSSYLTFGEDRAQRSDSLKAIMTLELDDRIVRRDAAHSLDSLFIVYKKLISGEPYRYFGLCDAGRFYKECKVLGESWLSHFAAEDNWQSFYTYSEKQRKEYYSVIVGIARSLPDYGNLPPEEIDFYNFLARTGQPYRPYTK